MLIARRKALLGAIAFFASPMTIGAALNPLDPLIRPAPMSLRPSRAVLTAIVVAGKRLVAVGENGIVLWSDDLGQNWTQAKVPVSVTLTGVQFVNPLRGWAIGHSGTVLTSTDGGLSWEKSLDGLQLAQLTTPAQASGQTAKGDSNAPPAISPGDPLLDLYFADEANGFVVGAFGLILRTYNGGKTWVSWQSRLPNPDGNHLYGIKASGSNLYVVGERGSIFISSDRGDNFLALKSPYEGSFFGLLPLPAGGILVYGLRGNVFCSVDNGQSWKVVKVGAGNSWTGAASLASGRIVMVSQAGEVVLSDDGGITFTQMQGKRQPLSGVAGIAVDTVIAVGVGGITPVQIPNAIHGNKIS